MYFSDNIEELCRLIENLLNEKMVLDFLRVFLGKKVCYVSVIRKFLIFFFIDFIWIFLKGKCIIMMLWFEFVIECRVV